jgi:multidrug efflux pump subunit AcrB
VKDADDNDTFRIETAIDPMAAMAQRMQEVAGAFKTRPQIRILDQSLEARSETFHVNISDKTAEGFHVEVVNIGKITLCLSSDFQL